MTPESLTDEKIVAFLDGNLTPEEDAEIAMAIANSADVAARVEALALKQYAGKQRTLREAACSLLIGRVHLVSANSSPLLPIHLQELRAVRCRTEAESRFLETWAQHALA